jgi:hypothetical protein
MASKRPVRRPTLIIKASMLLLTTPMRWSAKSSLSLELLMTVTRSSPWWQAKGRHGWRRARCLCRRQYWTGRCQRGTTIPRKSRPGGAAQALVTPPPISISLRPLHGRPTAAVSRRTGSGPAASAAPGDRPTPTTRLIPSRSTPTNATRSTRTSYAEGRKPRASKRGFSTEDCRQKACRPQWKHLDVGPEPNLRAHGVDPAPVAIQVLAKTGVAAKRKRSYRGRRQFLGPILE